MTSMPLSPGQGGPPPNRARLQELIGSMRVTQLIYLASVPQGGDIYVMKSVLNGLNDDQAVAVLKNCRAAMTASAKLLVIEAVLPPHGSPSPLINMIDVHRMVMTGSQERSQEDLRGFLETAGFTLHRVIQTGTQDNIFEALPVEPRRS